MVKLVLENLDQVTILEDMLNEANIVYEVAVQSKKGWKPPYLEVNGVPLDLNRAKKWIGDKNGKNNFFKYR